jgi:hypothetical protein
MRETFGEVVARDALYYGSSFWFRIEPVGEGTAAETGP